MFASRRLLSSTVKPRPASSAPAGTASGPRLALPALLRGDGGRGRVGAGGRGVPGAGLPPMLAALAKPGREAKLAPKADTALPARSNADCMLCREGAPDRGPASNPPAAAPEAAWVLMSCGRGSNGRRGVLW